MTKQERQEIDQMKADVAALARRLMTVVGNEPDLLAVFQRNDPQQRRQER